MTEQTQLFTLEKSIWTQQDFEQMGWHDVKIYGFIIEDNTYDYFAADLLLDIDYIFKWVLPVPPALGYTFWIAPSTLIFKECFDLRVEIDMKGSSAALLEIAGLNLMSVVEQEKNKFVYEWEIELQQGNITLKSYGFEQIVRQQPIHTKHQVLSLEQRGDVNFGRIPCNL